MVIPCFGFGFASPAGKKKIQFVGLFVLRRLAIFVGNNTISGRQGIRAPIYPAQQVLHLGPVFDHAALVFAVEVPTEGRRQPGKEGGN